jgi:hypothetical protein
MKGYYQMLGLEFEVIAAGRFKYPGFITDREPNQYFKEEYQAILDSWISDYKQMIASGRKVSPERWSTPPCSTPPRLSSVAWSTRWPTTMSIAIVS